MTARHSAPSLALLVLLAATLPLAGCDKARQDADAVGQAAAVPGDQAVQQKFNAYNEGFNKLIDDSWGVRHQFKAYSERNPAKADPAGNVYFPENIGNLERAMEKLREGRAVKAGGGHAEAADADVDALLPALDKLLAQWKELKPYFDTKAYRDDGLAKMKAADAELAANYQASLAAIKAFDDTLTAYGRARAEARLKELEKSGDMPMYHAVRTMQLADHLATAAGEGDLAEADRLLPQLEASLSELDKARNGIEAGSKDASNKIEYELIHSYIGRMVGAYRDYKQDRSASAGNNMIGHYNSAIEQYNDLD